MFDRGVRGFRPLQLLLEGVYGALVAVRVAGPGGVQQQHARQVRHQYAHASPATATAAAVALHVHDGVGHHGLAALDHGWVVTGVSHGFNT